MEILSFDIEGKFAHFRKFHGNNTAMSYSIPPRTTIIGMLAAIMGEKKDSYYETYKSNNLQIGIRVLSDLKKSFHRLNFLRITGRQDFTGKKGRVQTPFEVVTANDLKLHSIKYRIYLASGEEWGLYEKIKMALSNTDRQFNLSLGIASFSAFMSNVHVFEEVKAVQTIDEWVEIHSACNSADVSKIEFPADPEFKFNHIEEELLPADFIGGDKGREVFRMNRILFSTRNFPIHLKLSGTYYQLSRDQFEPENIQFLEYAGIFTQQTE